MSFVDFFQGKKRLTSFEQARALVGYGTEVELRIPGKSWKRTKAVATGPDQVFLGYTENIQGQGKPSGPYDTNAITEDSFGPTSPVDIRIPRRGR